MTKERTSNERFEIVGLTKAEADRCMEVLCGGPMPWDRGYCFASSELFARPSRYGPEPSNEGRKPMSDPTGLERARDIVANVVKSLGGEAMTGFGMTLRDYFAAKAMAALIAEPLNEGESSTAWRLASQLQTHTQMIGPDIVAHAAYMMADAMLKAREASND